MRLKLVIYQNYSRTKQMRIQIPDNVRALTIDPGAIGKIPEPSGYALKDDVQIKEAQLEYDGPTRCQTLSVVLELSLGAGALEELGRYVPAALFVPGDRSDTYALRGITFLSPQGGSGIPTIRQQIDSQCGAHDARRPPVSIKSLRIAVRRVLDLLSTPSSWGSVQDALHELDQEFCDVEEKQPLRDFDAVSVALARFDDLVLDRDLIQALAAAVKASAKRRLPGADVTTEEARDTVTDVLRDHVRHAGGPSPVASEACSVGFLDDVFSYHPPSEDDRVAYEKIRGAARVFARAIIELTPMSRDRDTAIRKVREAVMTANAAIALKGRV